MCFLFVLVSSNLQYLLFSVTLAIATYTSTVLVITVFFYFSYFRLLVFLFSIPNNIFNAMTLILQARNEIIFQWLVYTKTVNLFYNQIQSTSLDTPCFESLFTYLKLVVAENHHGHHPFLHRNIRFKFFFAYIMKFDSKCVAPGVNMNINIFST